MTDSDLLLYTITLIPFFLVFIAGMAMQARNKRRKLLSEKVLRPPAHSLRLKLERATDQFDNVALAALGMPLVILITSKPLNLSWQAKALPLIGFSITLALLGLYVHAQRRRFRVAIDGEVIVAEFLNELRAHGYRIYHHYPTDYGNIDHIVIGKGGIFLSKPRPAGRAKEERGTKSSL